MSRAFRLLSVLVLSVYLAGCGSDTPTPPTAAENDAAKATAAQMPPPPGTKIPKQK
jgi:outer membrane PBP1 activator LpoA protein